MTKYMQTRVEKEEEGRFPWKLHFLPLQDIYVFTHHHHPHKKTKRQKRKDKRKQKKRQTEKQGNVTISTNSTILQRLCMHVGAGLIRGGLRV